MAIEKLTSLAPEKGTFAIVVTFTDEGGAALVPKTLTWSLTDEVGAIINSRSGAVVWSPASSVTVVLSGNDLADVATSTERRFSVSGTYDSSLGTNLPLTAECKFAIQRFISIG